MLLLNTNEPVKNTINLISNSTDKQSLISLSISWLIKYGRYFIIGAEVLVLAAVFYKFRLDMQIAAIKETIDTNVTIYNGEKPQITEIEGYQTKINDDKLILSSRVGLSTILSHTISTVPSGIIMNSINITSTNVNMDLIATGATQSALTNIQNYANNLKSDNTYSSVSLENVTSNQKNSNNQIGTAFTINAKIASNTTE